MSFSSKVKDELCEKLGGDKSCMAAEIAALLSLCGKIHIDENDNFSIRVHSESFSVAGKFYNLVRKAFGVVPDVSVKRTMFGSRTCSYTVFIRDSVQAKEILKKSMLIDDNGEVGEDYALAGERLLTNGHAKRAYLRGSFLAAGSVSDPENSYHLELVCTFREKAEQLRDILAELGVLAKIVVRKRYYVVYIKEGDSIGDFLGLIEAPKSYMSFENTRIVKDMRNSINRKVNCETANINKTVSAAVKQISDIMYIRDTVGLEVLPDSLADMAELRLENPEASLKELGEGLVPPVGKSGVNHRLRKISEYAEKLREERGE